MRAPRVTLHKRVGRLAAVAGAAAAVVLAVAAPAALAAVPSEVSQATIEGTLRQGQTVSAGNGIWGNAPTGFTYQWVRCTAAGTNCFAVSGQTGSSYGVGSDDVGNRIQVLVTATNSSGSATSNSKLSAVVSGNVIPAATTAPAISGTPEVGSQLTTTTGVWTGGPTLTVQWQRCDANGKSCAAVTGATGTTYGVLQADAGSTLVAVVTGKNDLGTVSSTSAASGVVASINGTVPKDAVALPGGQTSVSVSAVSLPQRLVLSSVTLTPLTISSRASTVSVKLKVTDTRGYAVSGALVAVTVLPADRASTGAPQRTATDGTVTFTLTPKAALPLKRGATVSLFVRATKDGDPALAGVSAARLVQVTVRPASAS